MDKVDRHHKLGIYVDLRIPLHATTHVRQWPTWQYHYIQQRMPGNGRLENTTKCNNACPACNGRLENTTTCNNACPAMVDLRIPLHATMHAQHAMADLRIPLHETTHAQEWPIWEYHYMQQHMPGNDRLENTTTCNNACPAMVDLRIPLHATMHARQWPTWEYHYMQQRMPSNGRLENTTTCNNICPVTTDLRIPLHATTHTRQWPTWEYHYMQRIPGYLYSAEQLKCGITYLTLYVAKDMQAIEAIQRTFTYKITEVQHLNYWERLHELRLYSLQRCRERYIIIYIWKITEHMVPNIDGTIGHTIKTRKHPRYGTQALFSIQQTETQHNPFKRMQ